LWEYPDLQNILDAAPFLIFYKDTENRFVKVNKAFEDITGLSREQIIGKTSFDLFPSDADMYWQDDLQIINSGRRMLHLLEPMHVGGEIRWIQTNKIPYVDEQGKIIGIIGFSEDITEHRQMEQKLQENEEKYRLLFESSTDAITVNGVLNNQEPGCFLEVNKVACQLFGYTKEEMLQLTPLDLLDPEMISVIPSFREKLFRDNHLLHETVYVAKDRTKIPVELHTRLFELKGQPAVLSIIRNITKRKEGEALIQQYVAKVERSNRELEQYATIISHDLKTPLVSILGFSELLDKKYEDLLNPEALDFVQSIIRSGKRMQEMINSLLTLARLKVREEDLELVDCEDIISQVLEDMQFPISEAGANITHDTLPVVKGVKTLLSQVFANLIGNAIKFHGSEPPAVHIAVVNLDTEWQFSVQDNGIGFDPQLAGALFTIFRRFHTQAEYPGTGVGLSICKKIVEQHGGSIWAESQVGEGATFFFTLPKSVI
ncbi:MAG TPA: PAS domain S-box protein, partial [Candidatus Lokiarchaeia archaeon]|nr:PAS domain S-box protein [Candidatus Lokiarchaeia archaeon]